MQTSSNWLMGGVSAYCKQWKIELHDTKLTPENLAAAWLIVIAHGTN